jgi:hypothetical protein
MLVALCHFHPVYPPPNLQRGRFSHAITGARQLFVLDLDSYLDPLPPRMQALTKPKSVLPVTPSRAIGGGGGKASAPPQQPQQQQAKPSIVVTEPPPLAPLQTVELADAAIGLIAQLAAAGHMTAVQEAGLIERVIRGDTTLLIFAKHYGRNDPSKFLRFALAFPEGFDMTLTAAGSGGPSLSVAASMVADKPVDAIIVGAGLAGLVPLFVVFTAVDGVIAHFPLPSGWWLGRP